MSPLKSGFDTFDNSDFLLFFFQKHHLNPHSLIKIAPGQLILNNPDLSLLLRFKV